MHTRTVQNINAWVAGLLEIFVGAARQLRVRRYAAVFDSCRRSAAAWMPCPNIPNNWVFYLDMKCSVPDLTLDSVLILALA